MISNPSGQGQLISYCYLYRGLIGTVGEDFVDVDKNVVQ